LVPFTALTRRLPTPMLELGKQGHDNRKWPRPATIGAFRIQAPTSSPTSCPLGPVSCCWRQARHRQDLRPGPPGCCEAGGGAAVCPGELAGGPFTEVGPPPSSKGGQESGAPGAGPYAAWSQLRRSQRPAGDGVLGEWLDQRGAGRPGLSRQPNNLRAACSLALRTSMPLTSPPSMLLQPQPCAATPWTAGLGPELELDRFCQPD